MRHFIPVDYSAEIAAALATPGGHLHIGHYGATLHYAHPKLWARVPDGRSLERRHAHARHHPDRDPDPGRATPLVWNLRRHATMTQYIPTWIDEQPWMAVGAIGFLVRATHNNRGGTEEFSIGDSPARTNQSFEPKLFGWCGETNNVSLYALGLAKIVRVAQNGRTRIAAVAASSPEGRAALEELGWSELAPAEAAAA